MKTLIRSILVFIGAMIVTTIVLPIAIIYSILYTLFMSISLNNWKAFFLLIWRMVDGVLTAIGHVIMETAIALDMTWCVFGELFEDFMTTKEDTHFGEKGITVSSATGELELNNELNGIGIGFSKLLNKVFNQKRHAIDSWKLHLAKKALEKEFDSVKNV